MLSKIEKKPLYEESKFESHVLYKFENKEQFKVHKDNNVFVVTGDVVEKIT